MTCHLGWYTPFSDTQREGFHSHGGTPQWMVEENPMKMDENGGYPYVRKPPYITIVYGIYKPTYTWGALLAVCYLTDLSRLPRLPRLPRLSVAPKSGAPHGAADGW